MMHQENRGRPQITSTLFTEDKTQDTKYLKTLLILEGLNQKTVADITGIHKTDVSRFIARERRFKKLVFFFEHLAKKHKTIFDNYQEV